jgi:adenylate kinase
MKVYKTGKFEDTDKRRLIEAIAELSDSARLMRYACEAMAPNKELKLYIEVITNQNNVLESTIKELHRYL